MNKIITILSLSLALGCTSLSAQSTDEKQVGDQVENLRKAMIAGDKNALAELTADELSYGHSNGMVQDKATFIDDFVKGKSVFSVITLSEQTIKISGDLAIIRHRLSGDTNNNNVPGKVDILVLLIWQKLYGKWKLIARQAVKNAAQPN
jgi:ketosteroid isomerase-like protein